MRHLLALAALLALFAPGSGQVAEKLPAAPPPVTFEATGNPRVFLASITLSEPAELSVLEFSFQSSAPSGTATLQGPASQGSNRVEVSSGGYARARFLVGQALPAGVTRYEVTFPVAPRYAALALLVWAPVGVEPATLQAPPGASWGFPPRVGDAPRVAGKTPKRGAAKPRKAKKKKARRR